MAPIDDLQRDLELTGLLGEAGPLGYSVEHAMLKPQVPVILRLEGDRLVWRGHDLERPELEPKPVDPAGALDAFIRISSAEDVLRFAERWGPLSLCKHNAPACHAGPGPVALTACSPTRSESIEVWLRFARHAHAVVEVAIAVRAGEPSPREPWETLLNYKPSEGHPVREDLEEHLRLLQERPPVGPMLSWFQLKRIVDSWLRAGDVRPEADPGRMGRDGCEIRLGGYHTFGLLAIQLLSAVTSDRGIYYCHSCQEPYAPSRKPQHGRRHYCGKPECKRAGARNRKRAQRAREDPSSREGGGTPGGSSG